MEETPKKIIENSFEKQRAFFTSQATKPISFRINQLKKLKTSILNHQKEIENALFEDLHKSPEEAFLTEISIVLGEIDFHLKKLKQWAKPKKVRTPLHLWPSRSKVLHEPLGLALIIAPWNYPFQLLMNPLVGAISAGCCSILKPSPDTPKIAQLMQKMVANTFDENYITLMQGDIETNTTLIHLPFDTIFFTGSPRVGKIVMEAAAKNLTPVVLELGGKSPCIVDEDADIDKAAKRIAWGKLINAGQTCIAPDYLFAHDKIKDELLEKIAAFTQEMYGENPKESRHYPRIVSDRAMARLKDLLHQGKIYFGGEIDENEKYISPTIIDEVKPEFAIMQGEIFGPILPVMTFKHISETIEYVEQNEKPLALYYFGKSKKANSILAKTSSGGVCINDTLMHVANHHLPFGGVGNSGMGRYHGHESFLAFSHQRAVVQTPTWIDLPFKYVPFKYFSWLKKFI